MRHYAARTLIALPVVISLVTLGSGSYANPPVTELPGRQAERTVFVAGKMSELETLQFTCAVAASGNQAVVLFDSPATTKFTNDFLERFEAKTLLISDVVSIGTSFVYSSHNVPLLARQVPSVDALQKRLFREAKRVVVAPAAQRRSLLHAACLAGALQAPLLLTHEGKKADEFKRAFTDWKTQEVFAVGGSAKALGKLGGIKIVKLADEDAVIAAYLKQQFKNGPINTLVLANANDLQDGFGRMSTLAPWLALQKRAALVLTNDTGTDAEEVITTTLQRDGLGRADTLVIAGNLKAIPMKKRPNPLEGGRDQEIEMEPMTPAADQPCSFATGRLFHDDRSVIGLMLARQRLLAAEKNPRALIVSNPGGGLPLLETFSRNTANEFKNAGYDTTAYFGNQANKTDVKRHLPDANIFLWEGHHSTLVSTYGIHQWQEPLKPSLVFLQSCLALAEPKAHPFLQRGAVAVIGSSTRTYSGSGGAFSLAFFDTLLYEDQTLGGSLRQAKNFMLAFAELKKRRFGEESKLGGANIRSAWAFTLWGDPAVKMPRPTPPENGVPAVKHAVKGNAIVVTLPDEAHAKIETSKYQATVPANARLAGLVRKQEMADQHQLVPFVFAEVHLPKAPAGKTPSVRTKLPETHWVLCYDARCQRGYLLITPRTSDQGELRFHLDWE